MSPSVRGRGLKLSPGDGKIAADWSPSVRGRGLKLLAFLFPSMFQWSPSVRGRGLKRLLFQFRLDNAAQVALRAGAWIEMVLPELRIPLNVATWSISKLRLVGVTPSDWTQ